ncbi:PREDICTED: nucleolar and spindle-associated protein 1-like isoform X2 [Odobenus rosmarus divergens]|uniref:Nucleolar and spindle-associated protein 1-like isoform X2 n=1 Tax=Odobenus rosmarus divergens TaxID=9708 RepID=A0A2U3WZR0_ODORO|nr:PREDICTED: nucleolar and spindle-associated protein 1-like isoform X2 [Odobenus rosmarus divergens]
MAVPSLEELDSFKYSDLQNLAKNLGLRANLRADNQTSASSCDEAEMQSGSQEQAEREPADHGTKTRRRCRTVHRNPDSQQDDSEIKISDHAELQNQEKQENQDLRTVAEVPSPPDESQGEENAVSSGKRRINGNEDSKVPSERKKPLYTDGFSKPGKSKRNTSTTPNFKKLHEARFKEMESIDQYIERKKKHFEEHNSFNELKKQLVTKGAVVTPVPLRGRLRAACTPTSQRHLPGRPLGAAGQSTLCGKGSAKRAVLSATKMNVRFSAATKDNEHKRSLTKTPARKSPHVIIPGSTPKGQAVLGTDKLKTTNGNSVSPHKGKLKPWGQSKENNSLKEHVNRVSFHKKTYKQPPLQTREEQRKQHEQRRKEKKAKVLGARRGLIMAED